MINRLLLVASALIAVSLAPPARVSGACLVAADLRPATIRILPGEPVDLNLRIRNVSTSQISAFTPSEKVGNVTAAIADSAAAGQYKKYRGPVWGIRDVRRTPKPLAATASVTLSLRVLYQTVIPNANPDPSQQILTPFAFSQAGTFLLKTAYVDTASCPKEAPAEAIATVQVMAPTGADLTIWNTIHTCAECAYFLHTGDRGTSQADQDAITLLRSLVKQYPASRYARLFREAIRAIDRQQTSH